MKYIKLTTVLFATSLLSFNCKEQEETVNQEVTQEFVFKQGVALNHWLSYPFIGWTYGDSKWFNESDVKWIANQGFDHIKVYVSGNNLVNADYTLNTEQFSVIDSLIKWNKKEKLGTIITLSMFPDFKIDSTLSSVEKEKNILKKQLNFWNEFASHFSKYGTNIRFNIHGFVQELTQDVSKLNEYNTRILATIRKSNPSRFVYLPTLGFKRLSEHQIPSNDKNIGLQISFDSAIDIFTEQYGRSIARQYPEFPKIAFPSIIPNLTPIVKKDHWSQVYSNVNLDENHIDNEFKKIAGWMSTNMPGVEYYTEWGYAIGWNTRSDDGIWGLHYNPESEKDETSIANFAKAYVNASKAHHLNWSVYSYNYQNPLRYTQEPLSPPNKIGQTSALLKGLNLNAKTLTKETTPTLTKIWETDTLLINNESVIYDEKTDAIYVSCMGGYDDVEDGDGFIAKLNLDGEIENLHWVEGLNCPKGLAIHKDKLLVIDINQLVTIDLLTAKIISKETVTNGEHFNDLDIAENGDAYLSENYKQIIRHRNGKSELYYSSAKTQGINGVHVAGDNIIFTGNKGEIYALSKELKPTMLADSCFYPDGIESYRDGYFCSSWQGKIYYFKKGGNTSKLIDTWEKDSISAGDLDVVEKKKLLISPTLFNNKVIAYKIEK